MGTDDKTLLDDVSEKPGPPAEPLPYRPDRTVREYLARNRRESAVDLATPGQLGRGALLGAAALLLLAYDYKVFWAGLLFLLSGFYLAAILYKLVTVLRSLCGAHEIRVSPEELSALREEDLPVYTVLVPLYRESAVAGRIVAAMERLDYPAEKLDVKFLLEEDDASTARACTGLALPEGAEIVLVPHSFPKTKPKACMHGLARARGEYLVIYDAEDRPEPDQLRKAVAAFRRAEERVACLQVKLNYYNPDENRLTKWFTIEYTAWFDLFLPGLHSLGAPIPLGGTSNHFRTAILREVGGWDPFNVTEDCDLGIRLHRRGFRTAILDSTTWEEANSRLGNWIRQRSRWVKGYLQTHLVHTRSIVQTLKELGPFGAASFLLTVGGLSLTLLLNPVFWTILLLYGGLWAGAALGFGVHPWQMIYTDRVSDIDLSFTLWSRLSWVFFGVSGVLFLANGVFILINVLACFRRGLGRLAPLALLSPLYWALISLAAWKGLVQLLFRPSYWEKTRHGLMRGPAPGDPGAENPAHDR
ncbi:MAG: glycosyltransferase [Planctomycetota bacterium]